MRIRRFSIQMIAIIIFLNLMALGIYASLLPYFSNLWIPGFVALFISFGTAALLLRFLTRPLWALQKYLYETRDQLQEQVQAISTKKNEQDALLASMVEGVVALDQSFRILQFNRAAGEILNLSPENSLGRFVHEVIRVPEILDIVEEAFGKNEIVERDIFIEDLKPKYLQVHATPMRLQTSDLRGAVLVISDVTRLRELEGMRKDFVANVSHELRTPLTSIQGFAETLLNPSVTNADEIKKFVLIIQKHSIRLGRIIDDILALSRIEKDVESQQIELKKGDLKPVLASALELCTLKARNKNISLHLECDDDLAANIDPYLLEQAVTNLIDNAIRYSDPGNPIFLSADQSSGQIQINIVDQGIGIPDRQLPRIFERFYRVDKARSRELGGTGLGLSIVKHISIAHRGSIDVKSEVGKGSTFTLRLPALDI